MKKLGTVHNLSYHGDLIVKAAFAPPPGTVILDARGRALGRVRRVFGPVAGPYVTVQPQRPPGLQVVRSEVFVEADE